MRSFRHWSPRYVVDRLAQLVYHARFPEHPWLAPQAIQLVDEYLKATYVGLEFGSGRSTAWFARRTLALTSIEHDPSWYERVNTTLSEQNLRHVNYRLCPVDASDTCGKDSAYVHVLDSFAPQSIDYAVVDGLYRGQCVLRTLPVLKPGGLLIIDNVERYLPSASRTPYARSVEAGPLDDVWRGIGVVLSTWRSVWTTCGIHDTALYFKPLAP